MKTYRPYAPTQGSLFPQSPYELLPKNHLVLFLIEVIDELDLSEIHAHYEGDERGQPPYDPRMMLGLLVYGYCCGVRSSRLIEKEVIEDIAFRVMAGGNQPDHTRISEFRRIHLPAISKLFLEVLRVCQAAGLVQLGHVALDGTKVKANASKHKAMSYERMLKEEKELAAEIKAMLREARQADEAEDRKYGKLRRGDEMPEGLAERNERLARIRAARKQLEAEARQQKKAEEKSKDDDDGGSTHLPSHRVQRDGDGKPAPKAQRNFTDPDSRIMKSQGGFEQAYNCQAVVDEHAQVIVAQAVTNQPPDCEHFEPLVDQMLENVGEAPRTMTADNGYFSEANVDHATVAGIDVHIAAGREKHGDAPVTTRGRPKANLTARQRMARKLRTKKGAAVYARRKATVEPVFGQIKGARGIRQFMLRGLAKAKDEWALICTTHNLLKLYRYAWA
jgi:transposase